MPQCHDEYPTMEGYRRAGGAGTAAVEGAQCHDLPEISVLIAERNEGTRSSIRRALAADDRFGPVSEVAAGDDAVRRADDVDLVVVGLHSVTGLGALGAINRIARRAHHPSIVGICPRGEEWLGRAARTEGADDVIEWPEDGALVARRLAHAAHPSYS